MLHATVDSGAAGWNPVSTVRTFFLRVTFCWAVFICVSVLYSRHYPLLYFIVSSIRPLHIGTTFAKFGWKQMPVCSAHCRYPFNFIFKWTGRLIKNKIIWPTCRGFKCIKLAHPVHALASVQGAEPGYSHLLRRCCPASRLRHGLVPSCTPLLFTPAAFHNVSAAKCFARLIMFTCSDCID